MAKVCARPRETVSDWREGANEGWEIRFTVPKRHMGTSDRRHAESHLRRRGAGVGEVQASDRGL